MSEAISLNELIEGQIYSMLWKKRRGIYRGEFMDFVSECAKNERFNKLVRITEMQRKRQEKEELVLRFFALREKYPTYSEFRGVTEFLDNYLDEKNNEWLKYLSKEREKILDSYLQDFENMLVFIEKYFEHGFGKTKGQGVSRIYFEAISIGVYMALEKK